MLAKRAGNRLNTHVPDYVVFDLETTGVSPARDAVIEIAAVKVIQGQVVDEFTTLVNPGFPIPFYASQVNGIYDDMVQDSPDFETALAEFRDFVGDLVLVGHNIHSFDMKFIQRDARNYWGKVFDNDYVDTLLLSRQCLPILKHHRLVDLAEYYGISSQGAHRALQDCRMNQQVFECLAGEPKKGRVVSKPDPKGKPAVPAKGKTGVAGRAAQTVTAAPTHTCPECGRLLRLRNGRYGEFWGCSGYPLCRFTQNVW